MDILEKIVARKRMRLKEVEENVPLKELWHRLERVILPRRVWPLTPQRFNVIAEVKRASPSLGPIPWSISLSELVRSYEEGGAGVLSVLTEEDFFQGSVTDLQMVRKETQLPILRKDFIWTEYQVVESRLIGADAILFIASLFDEQTLFQRLMLAESLGLQVLVECRDALEVQKALAAGARIIGINNRDLRTFEVRIEKTAELCALTPENVVLVSESGIKTPADVAFVASSGANAVLVGESCLRQKEPSIYVKSLVQAGRGVRGDRVAR